MSNILKELARDAVKAIFHRLGSYVLLDRYRMLLLAFGYTRDEKVDGDYFEFGTRIGRTLVYAYKIAEKMGHLEKTRFHVFDSFEGFPEPKGVDTIFERFKKGEAYGSREQFENNLDIHRINRKSVNVIQGWYSDTLNDETRKLLNAQCARVVNIDCDMYNSAIEALRFITSYLTAGTVLLFDDYYCYRANPQLGEQKAIKDWLTENPKIKLIEWFNYETVGKSFIVTDITSS